MLPYSAAEPLATAIAFTGVCNLQKNRVQDDANLKSQWAELAYLDECERQQVFHDILSAPADAREKLPLR
ncbi:MAG: hypothetical protein OHK0011_07440 [Turneriella sp.]